GGAMPRLVYLLGVGVALVALAFVGIDLALSLRPGVTEANARRIREGMTLREVEIILGGPPSHRQDIHGMPPGRGGAICFWSGQTGGVTVGLGDHGRVLGASWPRDRSAPGPLARLRAWLGW